MKLKYGDRAAEWDEENCASADQKSEKKNGKT